LILLLAAAAGLIGYSNRIALSQRFIKKPAEQIGVASIMIVLISIGLLLVLLLGVG
jgi:hypothetical protein